MNLIGQANKMVVAMTKKEILGKLVFFCGGDISGEQFKEALPIIQKDLCEGLINSCGHAGIVVDGKRKDFISVENIEKYFGQGKE